MVQRGTRLPHDSGYFSIIFSGKKELVEPLGFTFVWPIAGVVNKALLHSAALSAYSVHHFHPHDPKVFLVPEFELSEVETQLPQWAKNFVVLKGVCTPDWIQNHSFRSRWIKTHALGILRRDSILLDADTIMVAPTDLMDLARVCALGAAWDRVAVDFKEIHYRKNAKNLFAGAGWAWPEFCDKTYFNTGVIVYRHCVESEAFTQEWELTWMEFVKNSGLHFDQAAFNQVSSKRRTVSELPEGYNSPVVILPSLAKNAHLYHYYSSGTRLELLKNHLMGVMLAKSLEDPDFTPNELRKRLDNGKHPYVSVGMPSRVYQDSGQKVFFIRARISELPADAAQLMRTIFATLRSKVRHAVKFLPLPARKFGRFVRDHLKR